MELNETLIISFLIVVIVILIFSKISIGTDLDESEYIDAQLDKLQEKLRPTQSPQEASLSQSNDQTNTNDQDFERDDGLMTDEFRKQLEEMENRFYYDNCRYNKT